MKKIFLRVSIVLFLFFILQRFLLHDVELRHFIDENITIRSMRNFLRFGIFGPNVTAGAGYETSCSSGIATIWPSIFGWLWGGSIFSARIGFVIYNLVLFVGLVVLVVKKYYETLSEYALFLALALYLFCYLSISYFHAASIHILGEVPGMFILGYGYYFLFQKRVSLAAFIFGIAVWHGKTIFLPFALLGIVLGWLKTGQILRPILYFAAPNFVWMLLILLRSGFSGLWLYIKNVSGITAQLLISYSNLDAKEPLMVNAPKGLFARLRSDQVEWWYYDAATRFKILFLMFSPLLLLWRAYRHYAKNHDPANLVFWLGHATIMSAFAFWYFYFHWEMWIRHILPAMMFQFGVLSILGLSWLSKKEPKTQQRILALIAILIVFKEGSKSPALFKTLNGPDYKNRFSARCRVDNPWTVGDLELKLLCETVDKK